MTRLCEPRRDMSACGQDSYCFEYVWDIDLPTVGFIFLHPHRTDWPADPEVGRAVSYAFERHFGGVRITYLFPDCLFPGQFNDHLGNVSPDHGDKLDNAIMGALMACTPMVAAWGDHPSDSSRADHVLAMIESTGVRGRLSLFGLTKSGAPQLITKARATAKVKPWRR